MYLVDLNGQFNDFVIYDRSGLIPVLDNMQMSKWWGPVYGREKHAELVALAKAKHGQLVDVDFKNGVINAIRDADPTYVPPPLPPPPSRSFFCGLFATSRKSEKTSKMPDLMGVADWDDPVAKALRFPLPQLTPPK